MDFWVFGSDAGCLSNHKLFVISDASLEAFEFF